MPKKASPKKVVKKTTPVKSPPKKLPVKKKAVKPKRKYAVFVLETDESVSDETAFKCRDKVIHQGNNVVIKGIYTDGYTVKYHLNNCLYVTEKELKYQ